MRNITKALTVVSLLAPVSGFSLGIGDIRVRSALNENLNAEINLVAARGERPSNIKVSLAPAEKFDEAGIPWTYFLSKLRFQPVVKANGAMVIKVTSKEALKEPYLNFLLEVSWPKGSLFREFTVLVDPPADYQHQSYQEPVYQEPVYPSPYQYDTPAPIERQDYVPRRRSSRPARTARIRADKPRVSAGNYGGQIVTRRNDTLWNVAARAKGAGVSVEQMMMALYNQNPQAFYQQNVNALSAGKALKIPEKSTVEQLSRQDALAEFGRHNEAWNTNRSGIPRNESQVARTETVDTQLKLEAPAEATVGADEAVSPSSEQTSGSQKALTPVPPTPAGQAGASGEKAHVDKALQDKINALEKQMANMEQLIALKDKQLAEMQNPAQTAPTEPTTPAVTPTPVEETAPVAPVQPEPAPAVTPPVTAQPTPAQPAPEASKPVQPVVPPKPVITPPVRTQAQPAPVAEESSPLPWILGALSTVFLGLFGWLWWRKQKILKETDAESMFRNYTTMRSADSSGSLSTTMKKASGPLSAGVAGESSFLNDFKASDFESFESFNVDHSDIDPVAEADVYLAYGRYQQAEELMKDAIKDHPERDDCKLKLLEIYQASSNKEAFDNYAKSLVNAGKKDDAGFWSKVILLARDISIDADLLTPSAVSNEAVFPTESDSVFENVLFDISAPTADAAEPPFAKELPETEHLGAATFTVDESEGEGSIFELAEPQETSNQFTEPQPLNAEDHTKNEITGNNANVIAPQSSFEDDAKIKDFQDNDILDFDLGPYPSSRKGDQSKLASEISEVIVPAKLEADKTDDKDEIESYEFNFDQDLMGNKDNNIAKASDNLSSDTWDASQTLDFSLEGLSESDADDNTIDFNFELEAAHTSEEGLSPGNDFSVSDLTDMDEMETKLDLAKAYVDMGDAAAAKEIIMQVIAKGSGEQKKNAQALLDELG
ncbi:MAG: hypothetical protein FJ190_01160 [Gammaproteobacteria bacterium]|nr:hypothetical protein [Gammaproteobacteria bacterium]